MHCSDSIAKWLSAICFRGNSYRWTEWGMISIILRIHNGNIKERRCRLILCPPMMPLFAKEFWPYWPVNKCVCSYCTEDKNRFFHLTANFIKGSGHWKWQFCHHLPILMMFQTCLMYSTFFCGTQGEMFSRMSKLLVSVPSLKYDKKNSIRVVHETMVIALSKEI